MESDNGYTVSSPSAGPENALSARPVIQVFIKDPVRGTIKSRLAATIGEEAALALYENFVLDSIDRVRTSGFPLTVWYYPENAGARIASWLGTDLRLIPQDGDDLGSRMGNAFRKSFEEGYDRALLIGSDIPDLPRAVVEEGVSELSRNDAVIGPAADGGYYLIGFAKGAFRPRVFQEITWSTQTVFQETAAALQREGLRVHRIRQWRDVDTYADLVDLYGRNRSSEFSGSRTMAYLKANEERIFMHDRRA